MDGVGSPQSKLPGGTCVRIPFSKAGGVAHTADDLSSSTRLEFASQLANSSKVQSQFNGLSARESLLRRCFDVSTSFATIVMSLSSNRRSCKLFNGTIRSAVNARRKLCVKSKVINFSKWAKEALDTATMRLFARSSRVKVDRYLNE